MSDRPLSGRWSSPMPHVLFWPGILAWGALFPRARTRSALPAKLCRGGAAEQLGEQLSVCGCRTVPIPVTPRELESGGSRRRPLGRIAKDLVDPRRPPAGGIVTQHRLACCDRRYGWATCNSRWIDQDRQTHSQSFAHDEWKPFAKAWKHQQVGSPVQLGDGLARPIALDADVRQRPGIRIERATSCEQPIDRRHALRELVQEREALPFHEAPHEQDYRALADTKLTPDAAAFGWGQWLERLEIDPVRD